VEISVLGSLDPEVGTQFPFPRFCGFLKPVGDLPFAQPTHACTQLAAL